MSLSKNSISNIQKSTTRIRLKFPSLYTSSYDGIDSYATFGSSSITANIAVNGNPYQNNRSGSASRLYRFIKHAYYEEYLSGSVLHSASI